MSSPGSVGAAAARLGRPVLIVSAVVALVSQSELQRLVQIQRLRVAQNHLGWEQSVSLHQQLISGDVDQQLVRIDPSVQQDPPDEVGGV